MSPLQRGELSLRQAKKEILAILARVPDSQLPKPDRTEKRDDVEIAWFGGHGFHIRPTTITAKRGHEVLTTIEVFQHEWLHRERERRYGRNYEFRDGTQR